MRKELQEVLSKMGPVTDNWADSDEVDRRLEVGARENVAWMGCLSPEVPCGVRQPCVV